MRTDWERRTRIVKPRRERHSSRPNTRGATPRPRHDAARAHPHRTHSTARIYRASRGRGTVLARGRGSALARGRGTALSRARDLGASVLGRPILGMPVSGGSVQFALGQVGLRRVDRGLVSLGLGRLGFGRVGRRLGGNWTVAPRSVRVVAARAWTR